MLSGLLGIGRGGLSHSVENTGSSHTPQHLTGNTKYVQQNWEGAGVVCACIGVLLLLAGIALTCFGSLVGSVSMCVLGLLFMVLGGTLCYVAILTKTSPTPQYLSFSGGSSADFGNSSEKCNRCLSASLYSPAPPYVYTYEYGHINGRRHSV